MIHGDLLVALRPGHGRRAELEPVQGALARERCGEILGLRKHRKERIAPQLLVIVEILVAERERIDALADHRRDRMRHPRRIAPILEAARELLEDAGAALDLAQEQRAGVGGQRPAREFRDHGASSRLLKRQWLRSTLCRHNGCLGDGI